MTQATRDLAAALELAEADLGRVLEFRAVLLPQHVHPLVLDIWPTIRHRFVDLRAALRAAPESIDERLAAAGLTGAQLAMKLGAYQIASDRARQARPPAPPQPPVGFVAKRLRSSRSSWSKVSMTQKTLASIRP